MTRQPPAIGVAWELVPDPEFRSQVRKVFELILGDDIPPLGIETFDETGPARQYEGMGNQPSDNQEGRLHDVT